ncbi:MAG TPA: hypothetical protein VIK75_10225 [Calditerricola sp.]
MTQTPHTPGPWLIRAPDNGIYDTDDDIANVVARGPYGLITIAEEVDVADARLIAAAPDLLDALKAAERTLAAVDMSGMSCSAELEQVRAAIARATGQPAP